MGDAVTETLFDGCRPTRVSSSGVSMLDRSRSFHVVARQRSGCAHRSIVMACPVKVLSTGPVKPACRASWYGHRAARFASTAT